MVCEDAIDDWTVKANRCPVCGTPVNGRKGHRTFCSVACCREAGSKQRAHRCPSPGEIKIRAAMIRSEWTRETLLARKVR